MGPWLPCKGPWAALGRWPVGFAPGTMASLYEGSLGSLYGGAVALSLFSGPSIPLLDAAHLTGVAHAIFFRMQANRT